MQHADTHTHTLKVINFPHFLLRIWRPVGHRLGESNMWRTDVPVSYEPSADAHGIERWIGSRKEQPYLCHHQHSILFSAIK
jgi:hypothetical protein